MTNQIIEIQDGENLLQEKKKRNRGGVNDVIDDSKKKQCRDESLLANSIFGSSSSDNDQDLENDEDYSESDNNDDSKRDVITSGIPLSKKEQFLQKKKKRKDKRVVQDSVLKDAILKKSRKLVHFMKIRLPTTSLTKYRQDQVRKNFGKISFLVCQHAHASKKYFYDLFKLIWPETNILNITEESVTELRPIFYSIFSESLKPTDKKLFRFYERLSLSEFRKKLESIDQKVANEILEDKTRITKIMQNKFTKLMSAFREKKAETETLEADNSSEISDSDDEEAEKQCEEIIINNNKGGKKKKKKNDDNNDDNEEENEDSTDESDNESKHSDSNGEGGDEGNESEGSSSNDEEEGSNNENSKRKRRNRKRRTNTIISNNNASNDITDEPNICKRLLQFELQQQIDELNNNRNNIYNYLNNNNCTDRLVVDDEIDLSRKGYLYIVAGGYENSPPLCKIGGSTAKDLHFYCRINHYWVGFNPKYLFRVDVKDPTRLRNYEAMLHLALKDFKYVNGAEDVRLIDLEELYSNTYNSDRNRASPAESRGEFYQLFNTAGIQQFTLFVEIMKEMAQLEEIELIESNHILSRTTLSTAEKRKLKRQQGKKCNNNNLFPENFDAFANEVYHKHGYLSSSGSENTSGGGALSLNILGVKNICSGFMNKKDFPVEDNISILWVIIGCGYCEEIICLAKYFQHNNKNFHIYAAEKMGSVAEKAKANIRRFQIDQTVSISEIDIIMEYINLSTAFDNFNNGQPSVVYTSAAADPLFNLSLLIISIVIDVKWFLCSSDVVKCLKKDFGIKNLSPSLFAKASVEGNPDEAEIGLTERNVKSISISEIIIKSPNILAELKTIYTEHVIECINNHMGVQQQNNMKAWRTSCNFCNDSKWEIIFKEINDENWVEKYKTIFHKKEEIHDDGDDEDEDDEDENEDYCLFIYNFFDNKDWADKKYFCISLSKNEFKATVVDTARNKKYSHQIFFYHLIKVKLANCISKNSNLSKFFDDECYQNYLQDLNKEAIQMGYISQIIKDNNKHSNNNRQEQENDSIAEDEE